MPKTKYPFRFRLHWIHTDSFSTLERALSLQETHWVSTLKPTCVSAEVSMALLENTGLTDAPPHGSRREKKRRTRAMGSILQ